MFPRFFVGHKQDSWGSSLSELLVSRKKLFHLFSLHDRFQVVFPLLQIETCFQEYRLRAIQNESLTVAFLFDIPRKVWFNIDSNLTYSSQNIDLFLADVHKDLSRPLVEEVSIFGDGALNIICSSWICVLGLHVD